MPFLRISAQVPVPGPHSSSSLALLPPPHPASTFPGRGSNSASSRKSLCHLHLQVGKKCPVLSMPKALVCISDASENSLLSARVLISPARLSGLREASPWCWIDGPHTAHHRTVTASSHIWLSSWSAGARQAHLCFYHKTRCKEDPWHLCLKPSGTVLLTGCPGAFGSLNQLPRPEKSSCCFI